MKKLLTSIILAGLLIVNTVACTAPDSGKGVKGEISTSGSSALFPLTEEAKEKFLIDNPDAVINLAAGGSGTGLKDVAAGTKTIGCSDVFAEEKLTEAQYSELVDYKVCIISMSAVVNSNVPINNISTEDLISVYTGEFTNWNQVEGCEDYDKAITLLVRPSSSGTRATFEKYALNGNVQSENGFESESSGEIEQKVSTIEGAIGYLAMSYVLEDSGVKALSINGVEPNYENVYSGDYGVWSYEHMYTKGEATGLALAFIEYMMGDEFAPVIEDLGYGVTKNLSQKAIDSRA